MKASTRRAAMLLAALAVLLATSSTPRHPLMPSPLHAAQGVVTLVSPDFVIPHLVNDPVADGSGPNILKFRVQDVDLNVNAPQSLPSTAYTVDGRRYEIVATAAGQTSFTVANPPIGDQNEDGVLTSDDVHVRNLQTATEYLDNLLSAFSGVIATSSPIPAGVATRLSAIGIEHDTVFPLGSSPSTSTVQVTAPTQLRASVDATFLAGDDVAVYFNVTRIDPRTSLQSDITVVAPISPGADLAERYLSVDYATGDGSAADPHPAELVPGPLDASSPNALFVQAFRNVTMPSTLIGAVAVDFSGGATGALGLVVEETHTVGVNYAYVGSEDDTDSGAGTLESPFLQTVQVQNAISGITRSLTLYETDTATETTSTTSGNFQLVVADWSAWKSDKSQPPLLAKGVALIETALYFDIKGRQVVALPTAYQFTADSTLDEVVAALRVAVDGSAMDAGADWITYSLTPLGLDAAATTWAQLESISLPVGHNDIVAATYTDANAQPFTRAFTIVANVGDVPPKVASAVTGTGLKLTAGTADEYEEFVSAQWLKLVLTDKVDVSSAQPSDFDIEGIGAPAEVLVVEKLRRLVDGSLTDLETDRRDLVYLKVPSPLAANAAPQVTIVGLVTDSNGNAIPRSSLVSPGALSGGIATPADGIPPTLVLTASPSVGRPGDAADFVVTSDEPLIGGTPDVRVNGVPKVTTTTGVNTWRAFYTVEGATGAILTVTADGRDGAGNWAAQASIPFEIDQRAPTFSLSLADTDPGTPGVQVLATDVAPIQIVGDDANEYPGDTHDEIAIGSATLEVLEAFGGATLISAALSPSAFQTADNLTYVYDAAPPGVGFYRLTLFVRDEAGNVGPSASLDFQAVPADTAPSSYADLAIAMTGPTGPVGHGAQLTYTVTVTNGGPAQAVSVSLVNALPSGAAFVSATPERGGCAAFASTITCGLGSIDSGASVAVTISATVVTDGTLTNEAFAVSAQVDPDASDNLASHSVTALPPTPTPTPTPPWAPGDPDPDPPVISNLSPGDGDVLNATTPQLRARVADAISGISIISLGNSSDPASSIKVFLNGAPLNYAAIIVQAGSLDILAIPSAPLAEGPTHTWRVTAQDKAGNQVDTGAVSFTVDTTATPTPTSTPVPVPSVGSGGHWALAAFLALLLGVTVWRMAQPALRSDRPA